jgi:hypothetical protein
MTEQSTQVARSPWEECVLLDLSFHVWGVTRKVSTATVDVSEAGTSVPVPPQALRLSKRLLACPEYDAIMSADGEIRRRTAEICLPFRRGMNALPMRLVDRVVGILRAYQDEQRPALVESFCTAYAKAVEQARVDLGPLYRPDDYPTAAEVREAFRVEWALVELGTPGKLRSVSQALYAAEEAKNKAMWAEAAETMRAAMREAFAQLVASLRERLDGNREDGKAKIFRDSRVAGLQDWLGLFEDRNVSGDGELAALVSTAKGLLAGVTADTLRRRADIREEVASGLKDIEAVCSTLSVADAPRRKFRLDGDGA